MMVSYLRGVLSFVGGGREVVRARRPGAVTSSDEERVTAKMTSALLSTNVLKITHIVV